MEPDDLIDSALGEFCRAEPRPGLERRVMARVRADRQWRWLGWSGVAAGLAVAGLTMFVNLPTPVPERPNAPRMPAVQPMVMARELPSRPKPPRRQIAKRTQFPTPSLQTIEEKALMSLISSFPDAAKSALRPFSDPMEIQPIEVSQLETRSLE